MTDDERLTELIKQRGTYSKDNINELREIAVSIGNLGTDWRDRAQFRASIETIAAIKQFDVASAELINTTNKLTKWILGLTILAVVFAAVSLYLSWLALRKP